MNPSELINEVRDHINKGQLDKALEKLLPWLETRTDPSHSWVNTGRSLLSQYKTLELAQRRSTISYENAKLTSSQITNALLDVLTAIEKGEKAPKETKREAVSKKTPWMVIGMIAVLGLAVASFLILGSGTGQVSTDTNKPIDIDTVADIDLVDVCPVFAIKSDFNIMILPYQPLAGKQKNIDRGLRIRLSSMMEEYKINGSVEQKFFDVNSPDYPITANQVIPIAKPCKAQLVIWGFTEEIGNETATITKFRFLEKEHFALTGLDLNQVDTISSISSIATTQELTEDIEKSIKLILGLVALETENYAAATELIEETVDDRGGAEAVPGWGVMLAESKIKMGEHGAAMEIYDEILKKDNQNAEALTRKGMLAFNLGNYELAAESLTTALEKDPQNNDARVARAAVYVRTNDLYQAGVDLEKVDGKNNNTSRVSGGVRSEYKTRHEEEETKKAAAEKVLEANPTDTSALRIQAQTARNLGQFELANTAAFSLLAADPKNVAALTTLMEIKPMVKNKTAVQEKIDAARLQIPIIKMRMMNMQEIQGVENQN